MALHDLEAWEFVGLVVRGVRSRSLPKGDLKRGLELLAKAGRPETAEPPIAVRVESPRRAAPVPPGRPGEPGEVPMVEVNGVWQRRR